MIEFPVARDLDRDELRSAVASLFRDRHDLWQRFVPPRSRAAGSSSEHLFGDDHVSLWLVCWMHEPRHRLPRPRRLRRAR